MEQSKVQNLNELIEKLHQVADEKRKLPQYIRYCEGVSSQDNSTLFNKRVFIGNKVIWIDLSIATATVKETIQKLGYSVAGEQQVPDGHGHNYYSVYYQLH